MHLLTVTCWKDKQQFLLQLISIKKYLKGDFTHFIIINDSPALATKKVIKSWHRLITEVYSNKISFKVIVPNWNNEWGKSDYAWRSQQVYKFFYYETINDDYIVLDSKNIFIRNTDINDFEKMIGSGKRKSAVPIFEKINNAYAEFFKSEVIEEPLCPWTPFVVRYNVLKNYGVADLIASDLYSLQVDDDSWPSEFIWYSYLVKDQLDDVNEIVKTKSIWQIESCNQVFKNIKSDPLIKLISIHRNVLTQMKNEKYLDYRTSFVSFLLFFKLPDFFSVFKKIS